MRSTNSCRDWIFSRGAPYCRRIATEIGFRDSATILFSRLDDVRVYAGYVIYWSQRFHRRVDRAPRIP